MKHDHFSTSTKTNVQPTPDNNFAEKELGMIQSRLAPPHTAFGHPRTFGITRRRREGLEGTEKSPLPALSGTFQATSQLKRTSRAIARLHKHLFSPRDVVNRSTYHEGFLCVFHQRLLFLPVGEFAASPLLDGFIAA